MLLMKESKIRLGGTFMSVGIDRVIIRLKSVIHRYYEKESRIAYFACLYLHVTSKIKNGIHEGLFEHPKEIEKLDIVFANKYLDAIDDFENGKIYSKTWEYSFQMAANKNYLVVQHLILGCNAHMNMDLSIAMADIWSESFLPKMHADFNKVNDVLSGVFDTLEFELKKIWPIYRILDFICGPLDEALINFEIVAKRDEAWSFTQRLVAADDKARELLKEQHDDQCLALSKKVAPGGRLLQTMSSWLRKLERHGVQSIIETLLATQSGGEIFDPETIVRPKIVKKKIAIIGGGPAGLATAFGITEKPNWQKYYDITLYSKGWRLGGKGATGRNPEYGDRIEEHGLHMWFGFYENSFGLMRKVFAELDRPAGSPISSFENAFVGQNTYAFQHKFKGEWFSWHISMPVNEDQPGDGSPMPTSWDMALNGIRMLFHIIRTHSLEQRAHPDDGTQIDWSEVALDKVLDGIEFILNGLDSTPQGMLDVFDKIAEFIADPLDLAPDETNRFEKILIKLLEDARKMMWDLLKDEVNNDLVIYRMWIGVDTTSTILIGSLKDQVFSKGFDVINHMDWGAWVKSHGLSKIAEESCLIQVGYDSSFGFFKKDPNMEAGETLKGALYMFLGYKQSLVYKFAAGCGDSVVAPVYEALVKRGVHVEFFHDLKELKSIEENGKSKAVELIFDQQMKVKDAKKYNPWYEKKVKGLHVWPLEPNYDQLIDGEKLKASGENLENIWGKWQGSQKVLRLGIDFDEVVLATSVAGLKFSCPTLIAQNKRFKDMVDNIKTTRTQAFQLWLKEGIEELGWPLKEAIVSCYGEPLDSWADISETEKFEDWSKVEASERPKSVQYFCGVMDEPPFDVPNIGEEPDHYVEDATKHAKMMSLDFVTRKLHRTLPKAFDSHGEFRWDLISDPKKRVGIERFDSQYWRANVDPSERYVLSVNGSGAYRLKSDGKTWGALNIYLAGDFTDNEFCNAGFMEAAIMNGFQCSQALCLYPLKIAFID